MSQIFVLEGLDGVGKTTIADSMLHMGVVDEVIALPTYHTYGFLYRNYMEQEKERHDSYKGMMLGMLDRQGIMSTIREKLDTGKRIVLDRWILSGIAYEAAHIHYAFSECGERDPWEHTEQEVIDEMVDFMEWAFITETELLQNPFFPVVYIEALNARGNEESKYDVNSAFQNSVRYAYEIFSMTIAAENGYMIDKIFVDHKEQDVNSVIADIRGALEVQH